MDVKEMLFMNQGDGENSYVKRAGITRKATSITLPTIYKAVESVLREKLSSSSLMEVLNVADLGCAAGPNTFRVMSTVIESTAITCSVKNGGRTPEIQFYFNDLVGNDFNTLFKGLSAIKEKYKNNVSCFGVGVPGSFYDRLFPVNSMHLIYSCFGIHWLSKAPKITDEEGLPLNRGNIFLSEDSSPAVLKAYLCQFQEDFNSFLQCRSPEMVPNNGRIIFIINGRKPGDPIGRECIYPFKIISKAISNMVSKGLIAEEKLDSFNAPIFSPSQQEVEEVVKKEGSFTIEFIETIEIELRSGVWLSPEWRAKDARAFSEPLISHLFGDQQMMDKLYDKVTDYMVEDFNSGKAEAKYVSIIVVLKKKDI